MCDTYHASAYLLTFQNFAAISKTSKNKDAIWLAYQLLFLSEKSIGQSNKISTINVNMQF